MSEKSTIVNGIDVSKCDFAVKTINTADILCHCVKSGCFGIWEGRFAPDSIKSGKCNENPNCYFKQLARAKEEIEKWKHQAELGSDTADRLSKELEDKKQENEKLKSQIENEKQALQIDIDNLNQACLDLSQENEELKHQIEDVDTLCSEKESLIDKYLQTIEQVKKFVAGLMFDVDCTNWFERFVVAFENWKSELGNDRDKYKKALDEIEYYINNQGINNKWNMRIQRFRMGILDIINKAKDCE